MTARTFRFGRFVLEADNRRLLAGETVVDCSARYLDALILLVAEPGQLVTKDRFMDEVWRGVPVTDEALTQCIRTLRRLLDDDAARPRFIETVPRHGYRFIGEVDPIGSSELAAARPGAIAPPRATAWRDRVLLAGAGVLGAAAAGLVGGVFYGVAAASQVASDGSGAGAASVLLVLVCLTLFAAVSGGIGVAAGIAAARRDDGSWPWWTVATAAAGGMFVGGLAKLLGLDAFNLLFGQSPGDITGGPEGLTIGAAAGLAAWLGLGQAAPLRRALAYAAVAGAGAGLAIRAAGGQMMGGSLLLLADRFADSRLDLSQLGLLTGEGTFGPLAQTLTNALEGALFCSGIVGAMVLCRRALQDGRQPDLPMRDQTTSL